MDLISNINTIYDVITFLICIIEKRQYLWHEKRYSKKENVMFFLKACQISCNFFSFHRHFKQTGFYQRNTIINCDDDGLCLSMSTMDILPSFGFTWYCLGWHSVGCDWTVWFGSDILFCDWCRGRWSLGLPCMLALSVWLSLPWLRSGFAPLPPGAVSGAYSVMCCSELLGPASFLF